MGIDKLIKNSVEHVSKMYEPRVACLQQLIRNARRAGDEDLAEAYASQLYLVEIEKYEALETAISEASQMAADSNAI